MNWYRDVYLKSEEWQTLRAEALVKQARDNRCLLCLEVFSSLDVHHLEYKNLYDVTTEELRCICRSCHDQIHVLYKKYKKLKKLPAMEQWKIICDRMAKVTKWKVRAIGKYNISPEDRVKLIARALMTRSATSRVPIWATDRNLELAMEQKAQRKTDIAKIKKIRRPYLTAKKMIGSWADKVETDRIINKPLPFNKIFRSLEKLARRKFYYCYLHEQEPAWLEKAIASWMNCHAQFLNDERAKKSLDILSDCASSISSDKTGKSAERQRSVQPILAQQLSS